MHEKLSLDKEDETKTLQYISPTTPFRYLGFWYTLKGDWNTSTLKAINNARLKLDKISRSKILFEQKANIIKIVVNKALEYHLKYTTITAQQTKQIANMIANTMKHAIPANSTISPKFVWEPTKRLGIPHITTIADTALLESACRSIFNNKQVNVARETTLQRSKDSPNLNTTGNSGFNPSLFNNKTIKVTKPTNYVDKLVITAAKYRLQFINTNHNYTNILNFIPTTKNTIP